MHPDQFIAEVAARLGLPDLAFNDEHVCRLVLDDQYLVDLEHVDRSHSIMVYSVVHAHASGLQRDLAELLEANLFGRATNSAVLALDLDRDEVLLHRRFELRQLDVAWFLDELDLFSDAVADWTQRLQQQSAEEPSAEAPASDDHTGTGLLRV